MALGIRVDLRIVIFVSQLTWTDLKWIPDQERWGEGGTRNRASGGSHRRVSSGLGVSGDFWGRMVKYKL